MIKNYLQVAIRNLMKNKSYVLINTFGLGIALACCITAYILVAFNVEFDAFHKDEKVEKIFKIHTTYVPKDENTRMANAAPIFMAPEIAENIAGIERYARFIGQGAYMRYGDNSFSEYISFSDSTFFNMFDFPLKSGSYQAFDNKHSIFLSSKMAEKYFGSENPIGKILILNFPNEKEIEVTVGGVLDEIPVNNTFNFSALMRIENFLDIHSLDDNTWGDWRTPTTFVELTSPETAASFSAQFAPYITRRNLDKKDEVVKSYELEPFKASFSEDEVAMTYVNLRIGLAPIIVFISMAVLILLIACFNLTNTSIAMTAKRLKEVGVRKALGAARVQIVIQFLFETLITIFLALIAGVLFSQLIVPAFTTMWELPYGMKDLDGLNLFVTLVILLFLASLVAGIYPAMFNSKFNPVALLKGQVKINGTNGLTRTLVALQFSLSIIVLVAGVVFIQNTKFQEKISFGYDKDNVITLSIQGEQEFERMRDALSSNRNIVEVTASDHAVGANSYENPIKVGEEEFTSRVIAVGDNYFKTLGFTVSEGREFNLKNSSDMVEGIIVNRAFLEKVNIKDPLDKVIVLHETKRHIIGVVENHVDNLFRAKEPEAFVYSPAEGKNYQVMSVKVAGNDLATTQKYLETTWKELFPAKPFQSRLQNDIVFEGVRQTNGNLEKIFIFLTILGGLLSVSGIFSLASLNIAKRTKEIGVRKVLGATVGNIITLVNKEFVIILSIAALLGSAGGFFLTKALLDEIYAYHIAVGAIPIILCALAIFALGISTTSVTIRKAATADPVRTLRSE